MNTRITSLYRDGSNYKQSESIVVRGKLTFAEVEHYLDEGEYFIPGIDWTRRLATLFWRKAYQR